MPKMPRGKTSPSSSSFRPALLLCACLHIYVLQASDQNHDLQVLLAFKNASDSVNELSSWKETTLPCSSWLGVSCFRGRVSRLVLEGRQLSGSIQPLAALDQIRVLSLKNNRLSGTIPNLSSLKALKLLFLSDNNFSGGFPASVTSLVRLKRLDLSHNNLSGLIPATVIGLSHILTLRLEGNRFSGPLPDLNLSDLKDFNVSGNRLSGSIPKSLAGFPKTAFGRNGALCGSPLQMCQGIVSEPSRPGSGGSVASMHSPVDGTPSIVSSSPSSKPEVTTAAAGRRQARSVKMSRLAVIAIVVGDLAVLVLVTGLLYCYFWKSFGKNRPGKGSSLLEGEKIVYSSSPYHSQGCLDRGKMVFFEAGKRFVLEDLLHASAEMLGKGSFGTAYKAVLEDGRVVAVKRLKEIQVGGRREFEQQMDIVGRLRHPNLLSLKAYYYARDEKLLISDFMQDGSLFSLLHGNRGPGRMPLDWATRKKIAAGAARGIAFIHQADGNPKLFHGNIKSTNVLLDRDGKALVSDFGLAAFAPSSPATRPSGYRAPEVSAGRKPSQKADVFAFGVLLLELLTGKCPSAPDAAGGSGGVIDLPRWVQSVVREEWTAEVFDLELMRYKDIEEEMVGMLQIASACTTPAPDQRPKMGRVVKMIEEIGGGVAGDLSPSHESFDSVSDSPSLPEDAPPVQP